MHLRDVFSAQRPSRSIEVFPPRSPRGWERLFEQIRQFEALSPDFVSVTYGAGGTTREQTRRLVARLVAETALTPVPHLTCVCQGQAEIDAILNDYSQLGITAIMALGGDPPQRGTEGCQSDFAHAFELVDRVRAFVPAEDGTPGGFVIGVAGFPEGHPATPNREQEMAYLKAKVDAGADYICTQLFFDNRDFFDFRDRCRLAGITVPIIAGIMPVTSRATFERLPSLALGSRYPARFIRGIRECHSDDDIVALGVEWSIEQVRELMQEGVDGVHIYSLNQFEPVARIWEVLDR
jgi:methylenetetrahydrofolate reductase (NADPH)